MLYFLARLKTADGEITPVATLIATAETNLIQQYIFNFDEPTDLQQHSETGRVELWGLQMPNNIRGEDTPDRLVLSLALVYACCAYAGAHGISCGLCVPRQGLLSRWQDANVPIVQVSSDLTLVYPSDSPGQLVVVRYQLPGCTYWTMCLGLQSIFIT